jgi:hypothetical protein
MLQKLKKYCQVSDYGQLFEGVRLIKVESVFDPSTPYLSDNNIPMVEGRFALVLRHDKLVAFRDAPLSDPYRYNYDGTPGDLPTVEEWARKSGNSRHYAQDVAAADDYTDIVRICQMEGFDRDNEFFGDWLSNRIANFILDKEAAIL